MSSWSSEGLNRILKLLKRATGIILETDPFTHSELLFSTYTGWQLNESLNKISQVCDKI